MLDRKISETEPFKVVKVDTDKGKKLIGELVTELAAIDQMLEPLIPSTSGAIINAIIANKKTRQPFSRAKNNHSYVLKNMRIDMKYFDAHCHVNFVVFRAHLQSIDEMLTK